MKPQYVRIKSLSPEPSTSNSINNKIPINRIHDIEIDVRDDSEIDFIDVENIIADNKLIIEKYKEGSKVDKQHNVINDVIIIGETSSTEFLNIKNIKREDRNEVIRKLNVQSSVQDDIILLEDEVISEVKNIKREGGSEIIHKLNVRSLVQDDIILIEDDVISDVTNIKREGGSEIIHKLNVQSSVQDDIILIEDDVINDVKNIKRKGRNENIRKLNVRSSVQDDIILIEDEVINNVKNIKREGRNEIIHKLNVRSSVQDDIILIEDEVINDFIINQSKRGNITQYSNETIPRRNCASEVIVIDLPSPTTISNHEEKIRIKCPVCLSSLSGNQIVSTTCGHIFCIDCIQTVLKSNNKKCPTCRKKITKKGYHQLYI